MTKRVFIITDFDYYCENLKCTRSIHYCVEFDNSDNNETLFEKACELAGIKERNETVAEWWIEF